MAAASHHHLTFTPPAHQQNPNSRPRPVSASTLVSIEKQRRDFVRGLGPCRSGCEDLDNYVLLAGGFERGSVVGISAEDEDGVGVMLGLQVLACSLLDSAAQKVQVITPKPPSTIVVLLKNTITAELKARGVSKSDEVAARRRDCLDRIMLSRVFDMDGLDEVLADLDATAATPRDSKEEEEIIEIQSAEETADMAVQPDPTAGDGDGNGNVAVSSKEEKPRETSVVAEIQDSQDEDETPSPPPSPIAIPQPPQPQSDDTNLKDTTATTEPDNHSIPNRQVDSKNNNKSTTTTTASSTPDIILITHFSSLLTSFFTQRDKSAAHAALRLLATRLRQLSRTLPSNPLIMLLNSTDSGAHASESHSHENSLNMNSILPPLPDQQSSSSTAYKSASSSSTDPTLRSIFNPAHHVSTSYKANKPTFGLVFTQLLDLHLLCTRAPRPSRAAPSSLRAVTVVEALLDETGLWEGERGQRKRREQRWTIVASRNGRMVSVPGSGRRIETQGDD
ncbi:hypothetical protein ACHAPE_008220 [Trichoderma viride]